MNYRIFSIVSIFFIILLVGCADAETLKYEGTVLSLDNASFLFVEKDVEIDLELSVDQAIEEFDGETVIKFILTKSKLEGINVGDKVIVHSVGNFDDKEPITGSAEVVEQQ